MSRARKAIEKLRGISEVPLEEYLSDEDLQALSERYLHILLEAILDLGAFVLAKKGVSVGTTYRDIVEGLIRIGVIPAELGYLARGIPGMRNVLVHGYAEIRHDIVYQLLKDELGDLVRIFERILKEAEELDP
ncbi:hypothetical protein IPA_07100 [Ignicoccus pacificus DSM 13166]|uniref:DUF86 domain-containing protein n=1 Tax=Ignicoccus pacificus DSM 13166 TaxID=940294 RepID=A0A977KBK6_9CREN|nr:hypothetical protein IPA_07100 [Ignicoccus pacificus DSM 13166]